MKLAKEKAEKDRLEAIKRTKAARKSRALDNIKENRVLYVMHLIIRAMQQGLPAPNVSNTGFSKETVDEAIRRLRLQKKADRKALKQSAKANANKLRDFLRLIPRLPRTNSVVHTENVEMSGNMHVHHRQGNGGVLRVAGTNQWAVYAHDDFTFNAQGWKIKDANEQSDKKSSAPQGKGPVIKKTKKKAVKRINPSSKRSTCGTFQDVFLGGYCQLSHHRAFKTYNDLPPHKFLKVSVRVHFFDSWQGESLFIKVNGQVAYTEQHSFCSKAFSNLCHGINVCGDNKYADRMSHLVEFIYPHSSESTGGDSITVEVGSTLKQQPCHASWGIDDVAISLRS
jgi:predicted RNA binding protein with dsRBD fold (UPF0201 family)